MASRVAVKVALIVDDSKLAQFVLRKMLRDHSIAVDSVDSAEAAITYLTTKKPDVIFMDHTMPGMDGLQAVKVIKDNPETKSIPIMMYTSKDDGVYVNQARRLGAVDVLSKELKSVELEKVLIKLELANKKAEQHLQASEDVIPLTAETSILDERSQGNAEDVGAISDLVKDAQQALEKETLKQFVQQELAKQHYAMAGKFDYITQQLDYVRNTSLEEQEEKRFSFTAANFFWPLMIVLLLVAMIYFYVQQEKTLREMKGIYQDNLSAYSLNGWSDSDNNRQNNASATARAQAAQDLVKANAEEILNAISIAVNSYNIVEYGDKFLGDKTSEKIESVLVPLSRAQFFGRINIVVHTGSFCLLARNNGYLALPEKSVALDQCQIIDTPLDVEQISTTEFRDLVDGINEADNGFTIAVVLRDNAEPRYAYPLSSDTSSSEWNEVAQKNNRVEFVFEPTNTTN